MIREVTLYVYCLSCLCCDIIHRIIVLYLENHVVISWSGRLQEVQYSHKCDLQITINLPAYWHCEQFTIHKMFNNAVLNGFQN